MSRTLYAACLVLLLFSNACSRRAPEAQVLDAAAEALGGAARMRQVRTLVITGEGTNALLGQNPSPDGPLPAWTVTGFTRSIDLSNGRMRVVQTRTAEFPWPLPRVQQVDASLDGAFGWSAGPTGMLTRNAARATRDRRMEMLHHPLTLLRAALADGAVVSNLRRDGGRRTIDVRTAEGDELSLTVEGEPSLPVSVASSGYDINLGDVRVVTSFSDYGDAGGLRLPRRITSTIDRFPQYDIRVLANTLDGDVGDLSAPDAIRAAAVPPDVPAANVTAEKLGRGLWRMAGQGHHSVVVELDDHLTLIEVPTNESRTLAVIARARQLRPGKPLTHAIITHHHFDHSAGLRAAVSEGLTIVTHARNEKLFAELVERRHTVVQDALARSPKPLVLQAVSDDTTLRDGTNEIRLFHLAGSGHADTLLAAYFPREQLLVQADVFGSGYVTFPFAANLNEQVTKRGYQVRRHVPIHGTPLQQADLMKVLKDPTSPVR